MIRRLKSPGIALAIGIAAFGTASLDASGDGYLPTIGPANLRFALAKPAQTHPIELFTLPPEKAPVVETNTPPPPPVPVTNEPPITVSSKVTESNSPAPKAEFVPADNMLSITPTMLNELFKTNSGATNQVMSDPAPVDGMNFQPPAPAGVSRATYKSE